VIEQWLIPTINIRVVEDLKSCLLGGDDPYYALEAGIVVWWNKKDKMAAHYYRQGGGAWSVGVCQVIFGEKSQRDMVIQGCTLSLHHF
jgi:hypothetical protein